MVDRNSDFTGGTREIPTIQISIFLFLFLFLGGQAIGTFSLVVRKKETTSKLSLAFFFPKKIQLSSSLSFSDLNPTRIRTMAVSGDPPERPAREEEESGFADQSAEPNATAWSSFINSRLNSTPRSRSSSPLHSPRLGPSRFSIADQRSCDSQYDASFRWFKVFGCCWDRKKQKARQRARKKRIKGLVVLICLLGLFLLVNWIMLLRLQNHGVHLKARSLKNSSSVSHRVCKCNFELFNLGFF